MRAIVQRVGMASVSVGGREVGRCGPGLLLLVGVHRDDTERDAQILAEKIMALRIFNDPQGKMNLSIYDFPHPEGGYELDILLVSNFTVYADAKSRRPSFMTSAGAEKARQLYTYLVDEFRLKAASIQTGEFGADMRISLVNDGPVSLVIDVEPGSTDRKGCPIASLEAQQAVAERLGVPLRYSWQSSQDDRDIPLDGI